MLTYVYSRPPIADGINLNFELETYTCKHNLNDLVGGPPDNDEDRHSNQPNKLLVAHPLSSYMYINMSEYIKDLVIQLR